MEPKRSFLIAGNWKMNGTLEQATTLAREIIASYHPRPGVEGVLCPPFTALARLGPLLKGTGLFLGAQNAHWEATGAFTGEVSIPMLKELGCRFCIIGHSERRQLFGETDLSVQKRIRAVLEAGLMGILCVGEALPQRQAGKTWEVVELQLRVALEGVGASSARSRLTIAYEPVWAIGTGVNATPDQAQEVHAAIRDWLSSRFDLETAGAIRIQYGGSVKPDNASELLAQPDVDGALVGGASLESKSFLAIIQAAVICGEKSRCSTA